MAWLAAASAVVLSLLFWRGYRKLALGLLGIVLVGAVLVYYLDKRVDEEGRMRITVSDIAVENVELKRTYRSSDDLTGKSHQQLGNVYAGTHALRRDHTRLPCGEPSGLRAD